MKVIKQAGITGNTNGFLPVLKVAQIAEQAPEPIEQHIDPIELCKTQLMSLSAEDANRLITEIFAQQIKDVETKAFEKGYTAGEQKAESEIQVNAQPKLEQLDNLIDGWQTTLNQQAFSLTLAQKDETLICDLIKSVLVKVLGAEYHSSSAVYERLNEQLATLAQLNPKKLFLHPTQCQMVAEKFEKSAGDGQFVVLSDSDLALGSYRIELDKGEVEHNSAESLRQFLEAIDGVGQ